MAVDNATVAKIAALARLKLSEAELGAMVPELNNILGWIEQLGEVDTSDVQPMTAVIANDLRLRADEVRGAIASGRFDQTRRGLDVPDLIAALGDWSPIAREWAAEELARRPGARISGVDPAGRGVVR